MKEQTILEAITDFLNELEISNKKVLQFDINVDKYANTANIEIRLCEHTVSTVITMNVENFNGCSVCPIL